MRRPRGGRERQEVVGMKKANHRNNSRLCHVYRAVCTANRDTSDDLAPRVDWVTMTNFSCQTSVGDLMHI